MKEYKVEHGSRFYNLHTQWIGILAQLDPVSDTHIIADIEGLEYVGRCVPEDRTQPPYTSVAVLLGSGIKTGERHTTAHSVAEQIRDVLEAHGHSAELLDGITDLSRQDHLFMPDRSVINL
jgi:hypothetical protein